MQRSSRMLALTGGLTALLLAGCGSNTAGTSAATSAQAASPIDAASALAGTSAAGGSDVGTSTSGGTSAPASSSADTGAPADPSRAWNEGGKVQIPVPAKGSGKGINIAYTGFGEDNPYAQAQAKWIIAEASLYGAKATFIGPPTFDPHIQSTLLCDAATSKKYQAIIMVSIDSASVVPCAKQVVAAGIKLATIQFPAGPDVTATKPQVPGLVTQIREDVLENARTMADGTIKSCENVDPCEVEILWGVRSLGFDAVKPPAFKKEIASHPNIKVVCETDANYTEDAGRTQAADCLQAHPNLHVITSAADESIKGAEGSIKAAGKTFGLGPNDIHLVGAYADHYGVSQIKAGKWVQSYYARPESDARAAVDLVLLSLAGKQVPDDVLTSDLDNVGNVVDAAALKKHPDLSGQW